MSATAANGAWATTTLSEIARVVRGRVNPQDYAELPFIGMDNVEAHTMRLLATVPAATMKSSSVHFQPGDVLYGRLRPYLNKVIAPDFEGLASAEFIPLTMPDGVGHKFIQYRMNASDFVSYASRLDEGDRPRVDYDQIGIFSLKLPPSNEQHRIVEAIESYFTRLDDAVSTLERAQRNLERYRASVLKTAVEGRLVPTEADLARAEGRSYEPASVLVERILAERRRRWEDAELAKMKANGKAPKDDSWKRKYNEPVAPEACELPQLPEGWCWATTDQLADVLSGGNATTATDERTSRLVLRSSAVRQGLVDLNDCRFLPEDAPETADCGLREGDLLFTRLSGTLAFVGNCAVVPELSQGRIEFPDRIFRARLNELANAEYVVICFGVDKLRRPLERAAKSSAGHQRISLSDIRQFCVPLPPAAEQARIASAVEQNLSILTVIEAGVNRTVARVARLRQSILKWAFEGRLVDQDPTDEPASALLERIRGDRETADREEPRSRRRHSGKRPAAAGRRRTG